MGAKTSKSELTRRKSFSTIGRSSQRSLFQKSKLRLTAICRQIDRTETQADSATLQRIRNDLDAVEKELSEITESIKAKNQEKYNEICKYLHDTRTKYNDKFHVEVEEAQEALEIKEDATSEIVLRNASPENNEILDYTEEPKRPSAGFGEAHGEMSEFPKAPRSPSVKFGVQVLPSGPQISQVVLKRKTYPANSSPTNEFTNMRNTTDGGFTHTLNGDSKITRQASNSSNSSNTVVQRVQYNSIVTEITNKRQFLKPNSSLGIEAINNEINELESRLKYFTGNKSSENYLELHQGLLSNLSLLENMDTNEDPIINQEKRILIQRINELLKILECLVEPVNGDCDDSPPITRNSPKFERGLLVTAATAI